MLKKTRRSIKSFRSLSNILRNTTCLLVRKSRKIGKKHGRKTVYIDAGLHTEGYELKKALEWFCEKPGFVALGFEANPSSFEKVSKRFQGRENVILYNKALVAPEHKGQHVTFYVGTKHEGRGDSVFVERANERGLDSIEVEAALLSNVLRENGIDPKHDTIILRMNIEGAEVHVLEDLEASGMISHIDGYFGCWNDPEKISPELGKKLNQIKKRNGICNAQFNNADFKGLFSPLSRNILKFGILKLAKH